METTRRAVIGIDGGNTKTAAVLVTEDGRLAAHSRTTSSNWQTFGEDGARQGLLRVARPLAQAAREQGLRVTGFAFGLSGHDRPRDYEVLARVTDDVVAAVASIVPVAAAAPRIVLNDAFLVLRAGTDGGAGVAVSSGTGGNCVGVGHDGRRLQIGGITQELGDGGGAGEIALQGMRAAGLARDGRGWRTAITDLVLGATGLTSIEDVLDYAIPGALPPADDPEAVPPRLCDLAPLVFEAARQGDIVARRILEDIGRSLGRQAVAAAHRLFAREEAFPLVLGGTVLMKASVDNFARAIILETQASFPGAIPSTLQFHPVLGAALLALDGVAATPEGEGLGLPLADGSLRRTIGPQVTGLF
jgi:N-acetylglucosamine kinase-like BadF-type ATPase